jgi:hypothetical protein
MACTRYICWERDLKTGESFIRDCIEYQVPTTPLEKRRATSFLKDWLRAWHNPVPNNTGIRWSIEIEDHNEEEKRDAD